MRGHHHLVEFEQRAVGARLGGEHVEAGAADMTTTNGIGQGCLVDEPTARGIDDDDTRLGLG
ncbi:Uncharacterised protein [Mycobacteroides abscessus]|nr:Uncharacterised protein [Mycobacteroides abscessus]